jgi:DNA invertase Pin-like site-specific DNA recombinase
MKKPARKLDPVTAAILAYSYIRFSHPSQAEGDSLRRQTEAALDWCQRHGARLDTSTTFRDLGKSAYLGEHRKNADRNALAAFLKLVEAGKIPRGSYLIIENLDRLSREHIQPALLLALNLLQAGIRIVQLKPTEMVFDDKSDTLPVMMMMMELSRGHSESAMKSERVGGAWAKKKEAARNGNPQPSAKDNCVNGMDLLTHQLPAWIEERGGKMEVIPEKAALVRHVVQLARAGYGLTAIVKKLNADGVPVITQRLTAKGLPTRHAADHWARSYVAKLLSNRAVIGEYQPYKGRNANRKKDGEPIPNYYPAIVSEDEWQAMRRSMAQRRARPGRPAKGRMNVFQGILFDARDGATLQMQEKGKKGGGRILVSYKAIHGVEGSKFVGFPFDTFEAAVLSCLREIDPHEILNGDTGPDETLALAGELARVEARIAELEAELLEGDVAALAKVLRQLEAQKKDLAEKLAEARHKAAHPASEAWGECQSLAAAVDEAPDQEEVRVRLRAALRRIVEGVWCVFLGRGPFRVAAVQIWFAGGKRHRDYLILHQRAIGGAICTRPAGWRCWSLADVARPGKLYLRNHPAAALALEKVLAAVDVRELWQSTAGAQPPEQHQEGEE